MPVVADKEALEKLTGLADQLVSTGDYSILSSTDRVNQYYLRVNLWLRLGFCLLKGRQFRPNSRSLP